jgi:hypothetical protein
MSEENKNVANTDGNGAEATGQAAPKNNNDGWVMPEPVFRRSSGRLPSRFEKEFDEEALTLERLDPAPDTNPPDRETEPAGPETTPAIAEQPDLPDEPIVVEAVAETVPAKKKRGFFRVLLMILGLGAIALLAFVIAALIYLLFFLRASESQNLN